MLICEKFSVSFRMWKIYALICCTIYVTYLIELMPQIYLEVSEYYHLEITTSFKLTYFKYMFHKRFLPSGFNRICSYLHKPGPCILDGLPLCVEWASFGTEIAPLDSFRHILL